VVFTELLSKPKNATNGMRMQTVLTGELAYYITKNALYAKKRKLCEKRTLT
jgi:hypothetical protein